MALHEKSLLDLFKKLSKSTLDRSKEYERKFNKIIKDDDWSFIIKSQAVLESSVLNLLIAKSGDQKFEKYFNRLSLNAKVELLKDLDLCSNSIKRYIQSISQLRNRLAHDPEEISFSFKKLIKNMSPSDKKNFINSFNINNENPLSEEFKKLILSKTKSAIYLNTITIIVLFSFERERLILEREMMSMQIDESEKLLKKWMPNLFAN
ncbi:hypothetical protein [Leptospira wolffii]|uniref:hypothetical protein n=1 Tax=Leptospira wolffii TaxID=409998 RepID=UPI00058B76FE|nr:hypothetical protein [Leptospira wolffii]